MKILKPGKVEKRLFVCPRCGCVFLASEGDATPVGFVTCPSVGCYHGTWLEYGEPYEEPTTTQTDRERLENLMVAALHDTATVGEISDYLIARGVTFREE